MPGESTSIAMRDGKRRSTREAMERGSLRVGSFSGLCEQLLASAGGPGDLTTSCNDALADGRSDAQARHSDEEILPSLRSSRPRKRHEHGPAVFVDIRPTHPIRRSDPREDPEGPRHSSVPERRSGLRMDAIQSIAQRPRDSVSSRTTPRPVRAIRGPPLGSFGNPPRRAPRDQELTARGGGWGLRHEYSERAESSRQGYDRGGSPRGKVDKYWVDLGSSFRPRSSAAFLYAQRSSASAPEVRGHLAPDKPRDSATGATAGVRPRKSIRKHNSTTSSTVLRSHRDRDACRASGREGDHGCSHYEPLHSSVRAGSSAKGQMNAGNRGPEQRA